MEGARKRLLLSKFKRCAHAVLFTIYLRRFCERSMTTRRLTFDRYYADIERNLGSVRSGIKKALGKPISQIISNKDTCLDTSEDDSVEEAGQKVAAVR
jgi:hypothetical protein